MVGEPTALTLLPDPVYDAEKLYMDPAAKLNPLIWQTRLHLQVQHHPS